MTARIPALIIVAVVAVEGVALDQSATQVKPEPVATRSIDGPAVPPADAASVGASDLASA